MTTLCLNAATFAELFPPEPPTAPMPPEHVTVSPTAFHRAFSPMPPPPPPEAFESPPRPVKISKVKVARANVISKNEGPDPRLPSNLKPHSEAPYSGPALKPGAAKKRRAAMMLACGCRLCALALRPALTFAEHEALGLGSASIAVVRAMQESVGVSLILADGDFMIGGSDHCAMKRKAEQIARGV